MSIKYNPEIADKALAIIAERNKRNKYVELCIEARVCPICGGDLYQTHNKIQCGEPENHFWQYHMSTENDG